VKESHVTSSKPGSFSQRQREVVEKEPGNEVGAPYVSLHRNIITLSNPAHHFFVSQLLRRFCVALIDSFPPISHFSYKRKSH